MRVPDEIRKCVCFLAVQHKGVYKYGGTAMILTLEEGPNDDLFWNYLVTARHCVERAKAYGDLYARFNLRDGSAQQIKLKDRWIVPEDESVDVAVMPFLFEHGKFDYGSVSHLSLAEDIALQALNIGIGDDLVVVGLFSQRHGTQRNIPIVRSGIIASMPDEPLGACPSNLKFEGWIRTEPVHNVLCPKATGRTCRSKTCCYRQARANGWLKTIWCTS